MDDSITCLFRDWLLSDKPSCRVLEDKIICIIETSFHWASWWYHSRGHLVKGQEYFLLFNRCERIEPFLARSSLLRGGLLPLIVVVSDVKILECSLKVFDSHVERASFIRVNLLFELRGPTLRIFVIPRASVLFLSDGIP